MVVLKAPIFDGRPDPWTSINWLDEMDQFFDQICLPDAYKVRDSIQHENTSSFRQELTAIAQDLRKIMVLLDSSTRKKNAQVPSKTNVEIEVQVPIDNVSTFMQQEEPIIESTQEEKFRQVSEDVAGALDVEVDSDESGIEPVMIYEVDEHLQVEVQKIDTVVQDKIVPVQHIDFVFPEEFYDVMELKVILLSVLPRVISDLRKVLNTKVLILHHYKTRGRVFLNQGSIMQEYNQKLFQYFFLDFQWIISDCNVVICLGLSD
ncbi:hypothetical protein SO802_029547 [Lithocarpus litseifolius]|uniref:Uncharacterized protein n=1 Tax=Lithocarpus litseifolius TaxID=425828 RepID=A0AAW2BV29_9ROSI